MNNVYKQKQVANLKCIRYSESGILCTYDFLTKRVPKLFGKEFSYRYRRCDWGREEICTESVYIYEQEVLATVFNGILGGEYSIEHKDDGRTVTMRLKPTKHF